MKLTFIILISLLLLSCSSNNEIPTEKGEPGLFSKDSKKGISISDFINKNPYGDKSFYVNSFLWRASLDVLSFAPFQSTDAFGGIIVTDWYSDGSNPNESIKISIRFLTNEIRSDSLQIKVFKRECFDGLQNCITQEIDGVIIPELTRKILRTATLYKNEKKNKKE